MREKLEFREIRDFGTIIGDTFLFIRQNFKPLLKSFFAVCGIFITAAIISMIMFKIQTIDLQDTNALGYGSMKGMMFTWEYVAILTFSIITCVSMHGVVLSFVALYMVKGRVAPTTVEVWSYFRYYFFRLLGSSLGISILLIICFVCCIVPGIYVFPAFSLFLPVMVLENGSFSHSFERSFKLLKGEWWITAATIFVSYIIFYMCSLIIQAPAFILEMISTLSHSEKSVRSIYAIFTAIFTYIAYIFFTIPIITSCLIYFNLVERKESTGLLDRINTMGTHTTSHTQQEEY